MSTDLAPVVMDADDARRLTERIRLTAYSARESIARLHDLVDEAKAGSAHLALGYPSWTAYLADVFGEEPLRLPRDQRQELVGYLAGEGMSSRAIAPIVGASRRTIDADVKQVGNIAHLNVTVDRTTGEILAPTNDPEPAPSPAAQDAGMAIPRQSQGEPEPEGASGPARPPVTGLDGKTYTRPAPKAAPRRDLTKQFFDAAYDLTKQVERIHRLTEDDRFPQNAEKVAAKHRNDLLRCQDLLEQVISRLA
jgi:hypothetical protein